MPKLAGLLLVFASMAFGDGGTIRGTVTEKRSGYALARATITIEPVPSNGQTPRTVRAAENGIYTVSSLPSGFYLIRGAMRGFLPAQFGQRRWNSAGTAVFVGEGKVFTANLQMTRYGAITGTVRDHNEVGIPDQEVAAYTNAQPPVYVTSGKSDDRGVFRIGGLAPGTYLVRSTGGRDDEHSYLATFSRQTLRVEEARPLTVYGDEDTPDGDVRPIAGTLFDLSGVVSMPTGNFDLVVTLASELGRTTTPNAAFRFNALPPGRYELYAEARESAPGMRVLGGYTEVTVDRTVRNFVLPMNELREAQFVIDGAASSFSMNAFVRRKDMAGVGPAQTFVLRAQSRVPLFPGHWEFTAIPPDGFYVSRFSANRNLNAHPDGWNEITIAGGSYFNLTIANNPGTIHGVVRSGSTAVVTAPVFLEAWDPITRKRVMELRETRTDAAGNYHFANLAPGDYRIVSTFEYDAPDVQLFDAMGAQSLRIEAGGSHEMDLLLYGEL